MITGTAPSPECGAIITASLAAAVGDKKQPEACPTVKAVAS